MASAKHCPPALVQSVLDEGEFHQDQADLENLDFKVRVWGWVAYFWSQVLWSWFTLSSVSVFFLAGAPNGEESNTFYSSLIPVHNM